MLIGEHDLYYFGVRSCKCDPNLDTNYMSSSNLVSFMRSMGINFSKEILELHKNREIAENAEQQLFDDFNAIDDIKCININSHRNPYTIGRATTKMEYFKSLFPELNPGYFVDKFKKITKDELIFRVQANHMRWTFINHPEYLKHYYPTTGTKTYWPGRKDRLLSDKVGSVKHYSTSIEMVDGTSFEQIQELFSNHYVEGQKSHVLETAAEHMKLLDREEWDEALKLLTSHMNYQTSYHNVLLKGVKQHRDIIENEIKKLSDPETIRLLEIKNKLMKSGRL